jgi:lipopolysaccharide export system protein LptA
MVVIFISLPAAADEIPLESKKASVENRIHITADTLITNTGEKNAEFSGNVTAIQGTTVITSDRLNVFYREHQQEGPAADTDIISRIVAQGNVKIVFDNQVATAEHAEYLADKRIVVLSGTDTTIISGGNSISGSRITFFQDEGRIQVESGKEKRVEAFFYSQENGPAFPMKNSEP